MREWGSLTPHHRPQVLTGEGRHTHHLNIRLSFAEILTILIVVELVKVEEAARDARAASFLDEVNIIFCGVPQLITMMCDVRCTIVTDKLVRGHRDCHRATVVELEW